MPIKDIFHVNVNCTDLERSRRFYELVGFQVVREISVGGSAEMLGGLGLPADRTARALLMMLEPDKPRGTRLDLIEWVNPPTTGTTPPDLTHVGAVRIALWTIGIDAEYERLRAEGVEFLSPPATMPGPGGTRGARFCCFPDPDGTILELIDFA